MPAQKNTGGLVRVTIPIKQRTLHYRQRYLYTQIFIFQAKKTAQNQVLESFIYFSAYFCKIFVDSNILCIDNYGVICRF